MVHIVLYGTCTLPQYMMYDKEREREILEFNNLHVAKPPWEDYKQTQGSSPV